MSAVHPCEQQNRLAARVVVVDRVGRASEATKEYSCVSLVHGQGVVYSLTYGWINRIQNARTGRSEFRRVAFESQEGAVVTGFYTHPEGNQTHFRGTLTGDRGIRFVLDDATIEFTGEVVINDQSAGLAYSVDRHLLLNTRGASADGIRLDFTFIDPF